MSAPPRPLSAVVDTDAVRSFRPLILGRMPGKYVTGVSAVLRRVLYGWLCPKGSAAYDLTWGEGLLTIQGTTLSDKQVLGLRGRLEASARSEDYVRAASAPVSLVSGLLSVPGKITLVDGKTYALEVELTSMDAALRAIGS